MALSERIFISYSHKDRVWMELVRTHLKPLERLGKVVAWDDRQIAPGAQWRSEILKALAAARAGILLVSPHFLASDFIIEHELPALLAKPNIFWIAISSSSYQLTPLKEIQAANDPKRPLDSLGEAEIHCILVGVLEKLTEAVLNPPRAPRDSQSLIPVGERVVSAPGGEMHTAVFESLPAQSVGNKALLPASGLRLGDLFRLEVAPQDVGGEFKLRIDVGFFSQLIGRAVATGTPITCGCATARVLLAIEAGASRGDPDIPRPLRQARIVVEFGPGRAPRIRFEVEPPAKMLDGWSRLEYSIEIETRMVSGEDKVDLTVRPRGRVRLLPEWFTVDWVLAGLEGLESELNAARTLANGVLLESSRKRSQGLLFQF
jgi:hypothetical protein